MSVDDGPSVEMGLFASYEQPLSAADAERLLALQGADPDAPEEQQALAMMLGHAAGPASTRELAGEVSAVAVFALLKEQKKRRSRARRRPLLAACASAAVVMALSGTAAADALPAPMQRVAHDTFGAPAPRPVGPAVSTTPEEGRSKQHPATLKAPPGRSASAKSSHGKGKAHGKAVGGKAVGRKAVGKAVGQAKAAKPKPVPNGVAKGHSAGHALDKRGDQRGHAAVPAGLDA